MLSAQFCYYSSFRYYFELAILLPQLPEYWDSWHVPSGLAGIRKQNDAMKKPESMGITDHVNPGRRRCSAWLRTIIRMVAKDRKVS